MNSQAIQRVLERTLEAEVRAAPPRHDIDPYHVDEWLDLKVGNDLWHLAIEQKTSPGQAIKRIRGHQRALRSEWPDVVPMLAVPRLSRRERQVLEDNSINYLDLSGSIWIRFPGLVVQAEGRRLAPSTGPRKTGRNPFSKKASLVARALLEHPSRHWRVRDISKESSLSVGYASEVLRSLVARGYSAEDSKGFRLSDPVSLLRDWSAVYRWEDNEIHSFVAPFGKDELGEKASGVLRRSGATCMLTLLAAMDQLVRYVEHDQVHIYVNDFPHAAESALRTQLHAEAVPRGGNLHILKPYHGESVRYAAQDIDGVTVVSDVQLFLDLIHYPVRGPEAAAILLRKRLGRRLGLSKSDIDSLREGLGL
jgi:Transcriptional regulator, AbiEi antitoxin, Type IV TA system